MNMLALGATLEEITPEALKEEGRSAVFLTDSFHVKEAHAVFNNNIHDFLPPDFDYRMVRHELSKYAGAKKRLSGSHFVKPYCCYFVYLYL